MVERGVRCRGASRCERSSESAGAPNPGAMCAATTMALRSVDRTFEAQPRWTWTDDGRGPSRRPRSALVSGGRPRWPEAPCVQRPVATHRWCVGRWARGARRWTALERWVGDKRRLRSGGKELGASTAARDGQSGAVSVATEAATGHAPRGLACGHPTTHRAAMAWVRVSQIGLPHRVGCPAWRSAVRLRAEGGPSPGSGTPERG